MYENIYLYLTYEMSIRTKVVSIRLFLVSQSAKNPPKRRMLDKKMYGNAEQ